MGSDDGTRGSRWVPNGFQEQAKAGKILDNCSRAETAMDNLFQDTFESASSVKTAKSQCIQTDKQTELFLQKWNKTGGINM